MAALWAQPWHLPPLPSLCPCHSLAAAQRALPWPNLLFLEFSHTFELCKRLRELNPTRNQRGPRAALLHRACCADADLLFRNSSWTISRYLEGDCLVSAVNRSVQGGVGKDVSPVWLTRQKTSCLEDWCKLSFSLGWTRRRVRTSTVRNSKFHKDNCPAKHWKWWQAMGYFSQIRFFVEMGSVPLLSELYTIA